MIEERKLLKRDIEISINNKNIFYVEYDKGNITFGFEDSILENVKCVKEKKTMDMLDLYKTLPKNFKQDKDIVISVIKFLQDDKNTSRIIEEFTQKGISLPAFNIAPDMIEHPVETKDEDWSMLKNRSILKDKNGSYSINKKAI